MPVESRPPHRSIAASDPKTFWADFLAQGQGIDSVLANRLLSGSEEAIEYYRNHPSASFFHDLMSLDDDLPGALAQRLCINGIFRVLHYRLKSGVLHAPAAPAEPPPTLCDEADTMLTEDLIERRLCLEFPNWTMATLDRVLPRSERYYVGLTSVVDYLRWIDHILNEDRHHRRCGLPHSDLWKTALVDAVLQQPEEGVLRFVEPWVRFHGCISTLAARQPFVEGVRNALRFASGRFRRGSEERLKLIELLDERHCSVLLDQFLSYWREYSVPWFALRELLHDFTEAPVMLF